MCPHSIWNEEGSLVGAGVAYDITEQVQTQEDLKKRGAIPFVI
jgi:hypothetical protein